MYYSNKKGGTVMINRNCIAECMIRHIGQTVTIFTESGGISGAGFTGVLACVDDCVVRLITSIGAPPACPVGSSCLDGFSGGFGGGFGGGIGSGSGFGGGCCGGGGIGGGVPFAGNWLGSVCEIPINQIVCFTHHSI
jgi:hypothetical protein